MTGPWTAIEPAAANRYSTGFEVWNERWVSIRWKPTVMPKPVMRYIATQEREVVQADDVVPEDDDRGGDHDGGRTTASRLTTRAVLVMC